VERLPQPNRRRVVWDSSWVIFGLTGWNLAVLRSSCFRVWHCLARVAEWIIQKLLVKRQDKYWKVKADGEQNYRDDEAFGYKLFVTIIYPGILRLHWRHLISSY
jgi:hypothetical protein